MSSLARWAMDPGAREPVRRIKGETVLEIDLSADEALVGKRPGNGREAAVLEWLESEDGRGWAMAQRIPPGTFQIRVLRESEQVVCRYFADPEEKAFLAAHSGGAKPTIQMVVQPLRADLPARVWKLARGA